MSERAVLFEKAGGIGRLTLNRAEHRNAITQGMMHDIRAALAEAEADPDLRVVVLNGAGPCFSSGFDIKEQLANRPTGRDAWDRILRNDVETVMSFWRLGKPTIAAVHGACFGGALQLATSCDLTIAAEDTVFGEPELMFGATVAVLILPWLVPPKIAKELILTGEDGLSARRAHEIGLVNRLTPGGAEAVEEAAFAMARRIALMDPVLVQSTKRAINLAYEGKAMADAIEAALDINIGIEAVGSPDKHLFMQIARTDGLKAAFAWRAARFADEEE